MAAKKSKPRKPPEQAALESTAPEKTFPSVSKAEAVRRAVAAGNERPAEGVAYILDEFGIEMDNKTFSLNKAQQKSREARKAEAAPAPRVESGRPIEGFLAPPPRKMSSGGGDLIEVMEKMKPLVAMHGADQVKRLVDLLG
ncbi:hypothetical protein [Singulisphaera sp. PoT]|uniref:hypothetical protein n=1 Tax=Singulisphaera sp. PoT TaxID=3411797 RepID=UPI003BF5EF7B